MNIPIYKDLDLNSTEALLKRFYSFKNPFLSEITFDFSNSEFICLNGLLFLLGLSYCLKNKKLKNNLDVKNIFLNLTSRNDIKNHLHKMQFFKTSCILNNCFNNGEKMSEIDKKQYQENKEWQKVDWEKYHYYPIYYISKPKHDSNLFLKESECSETMGNFLNSMNEIFILILEKVLNFPKEAIYGSESGKITYPFWQPIKELYENIFLHSNSWGITALQVYRNRIDIGFFDIGLGIKTTINQKFSFETDKEAITNILKKGLSCKKEGGAGLAIVKNYVSKWGGILTIRSGEAKIRVKGDDLKTYDVDYFPGTQIFISIPRYYKRGKTI